MVTQVPLLDLRRFDAAQEAEMVETFRRVLKSGHYILGPEVDGLEKECADYLKVKHAIGVSSGTDALLVALMALDIGPGDEVICPTYTFFATAGCVWRTGAKPVFVEIDPVTYNCDPADIARKVTAKTKAIMPVHLFGQCAEMNPLLDLSKSKGIPIIEDAAQAIGSEYQGNRAGAMGAIGCFSFFPSKNLGCLGDGGLVTTNDDVLAEKLKVLRAHGGKPKYYHGIVGGNFRIDALQAALIRVKLKQLDASTEARQKNAALYTQLLTNAGIATYSTSADAKQKPLWLPVVKQNRHIFNQYILRLPQEGARDRLRSFLNERKVGTEVYYPVPMHLQQCFASLGHKEGDFPLSEAAAKQTIAIPIFPELTEEEIRFVVDQLVAFFK